MALTGYAKVYSEARKAGKSDTEAHAEATRATGSGGGYSYTTSGNDAGKSSRSDRSTTKSSATPATPATTATPSSANWVRNVWGQGDYGPLTGTVGSRTMMTPQGLKKEGVDFFINPADDRAYTYNWENLNKIPELPPEEKYMEPYLQQEQYVEQFDPTAYIEQLKTAKRQSLLAALDKARTTALTGLETEKANVAPTYYDARNRAAAASDVGAMNFAQYMAARGIKGAAGAMPEIYRQAGLQGQIGALDRAEANALANIERQRSNIESGYASDVAAAEADVESQAMQALIDQWNANRQYELQKATLTGSLGDQRTLAGLEYDWSRSPSNPAVQAQILANKKAALDIAYQEIINSYLPETEKLKAERLKQQVEAGQYDVDIALAQINKMRAQGRSSGSSGGGGSSVSDTEMKRNNLSQAQNKIWSDLNSGKTIQQLEAEIMRDASKYTQLGLDVDDLVDYAWYAATGALKKTQSGDSAALIKALLGQ